MEQHFAEYAIQDFKKRGVYRKPDFLPIPLESILGNQVSSSKKRKRNSNTNDLLQEKENCLSRDPKFFHRTRTPETDETTLGQGDSSRLEQIPDFCAACLGLLQIDFSSLALYMFSNLQARKIILERNTFNISIRFPFQLPIRQQGFQWFFNRKDENPYLMDQQEAKLDVKDVFKILFRHEFEKISGLDFDRDSSLTCNLRFSHKDTEQDYQFLTLIPSAKFSVKVNHKKGRTIYQGASLEKIARAVKNVSKQDFIDAKQCPPPAISSAPILLHPSDPNNDADFFTHSSLYIAGRYCKLKRHISNSQWIIKGKRMTEDSIEELIGNFLGPAFGNQSYKFSSAGREDSDVLMLGDGRPFYFELINPRIGVMDQKDLQLLELKINDGVEEKIKVFDLQLVSLSDTSVLKNSASSKSKSYLCMVHLEKPVLLSEIEKLSGTVDLKLAQRNPTRVPRRADMVREKFIEKLILTSQVESPNDLSTNRILASLQTSAGTYVKEFMHGDDERTVPSLSSLLDCGKVTVEYLDVSRVHLEWPKRLSSKIDPLD